MIDTGSSFLWVLDGCINESECGKSPRFSPAHSSSLHQTHEFFNIPYMDGWTSGHISYDTVSLAGQTASNFRFGEWGTRRARSELKPHPLRCVLRN